MFKGPVEFCLYFESNQSMFGMQSSDITDMPSRAPEELLVSEYHIPQQVDLLCDSQQCILILQPPDVLGHLYICLYSAHLEP